MKHRCIGLLCASMIVILIAAPEGAPQVPAATDVKGWHGAEWGMTLDQAAAAIGASLEPIAVDAQTLAKNPDLKGYRAANIQLGDWTAEARFYFNESGRKGLTSIGLDLGDVLFTPVRDELKGKYGAPTSETSERLAGGTVRIQRAKWVLPNTEITCERWETSTTKPSVLITYSQHRAIVL